MIEQLVINKTIPCRLSTSNKDQELDISMPPMTESVAPMTHESRITEILSLLRGGRLSPFDLVLEVLDKSQPKYSSYQVEFYKENNQKLSMILDKITSSARGKIKFSSWLKSESGLKLVCEIIGGKMDEVQKVEKLSTLASVTPEFIKDWSISGCPELAPCMTEILLAAAETSLAHEKNKKKMPDAVRISTLFHVQYNTHFNRSAT